MGLLGLLNALLSLANGGLALGERISRLAKSGWRKMRKDSRLGSNSLEGLSFDITVFEKADSPRRGSGDPSTSLKYRSERGVDGIQSLPEMGYLRALAIGGPIGPITLPGMPFSWDWPTLDVKVVNNSSQTVYLTRMDILVQRSNTNLEPVPVFADLGHHNALGMFILNEGWGDMIDCRLKFNLVPYTDSIKGKLPSIIDFDQPYSHELTRFDVTASANVDLSAAFEKEGVDVAKVRSRGPSTEVFRAGGLYRRVNADGTYSSLSLEDFESLAPPEFGKFKTGGAVIYGTLNYVWHMRDGVQREHTVRFYNVVWLYEEYGSGTGMYPTEHYDVDLQADCEDYQVTKPISQVLRPGEVDRFIVRIGVQRSSEHRFCIKFSYNGHRTFATEQIYLNVFVPRSDAPKE